MRPSRRRGPEKIIATAIALETATGLAALIAPGLVISWLLGPPAPALALDVGRCFGIALLALSLACWPPSRPALRAMLAYNALVALLLAYLAFVEHYHALLLWPAIALHGIFTVLFLRAVVRR